MATGATGQLGLALPVQGELSGTWGDTVNNGITQYTNIAIAATLTLTGDGAVTLANTTGDASASNITSTLAGAGTVTAQFAMVRVSGTTTTKVVTGPSYSKSYIIDNASSYGVTFKASGQTGVLISPGEKVGVYYNATDYVKIGGGGITYGAVKTTTYTAVSNDGVLTNTTGGAFTVNLPATPATGTQVFIADSAGTWATNNLTIGRNGSTIAGSATDLVCDINSVSIQCVYDGTTWDIFAQIGANDTAVVTLNGTQTLTNKTLTSPTITGTGAIAAATVTLSSTLSVTGVSTLTGGAVIQGLTVGRGAGAVSTNTAVGVTALAANTSGANNIAVGVVALQANTTGSQNIAMGRYALVTNTTGNFNVGIGHAALSVNSTASNNTAVGSYALEANTTADENVAIGALAMTSTTTGNAQVAVGKGALQNNTTGAENTAVGRTALQATNGSYNSGFGRGALQANSTGSSNTASGAFALFSNTTASGSTAIGHLAGYTNATGTKLTVMGYAAGYYNTANNLTAVGYLAAYNNSSGGQNTAIGSEALYNNTTGGNNVALGTGALTTNTTGSDNTALGKDALVLSTTASNNTAVGFQTLYSSTTATNNTAVGHQAGFSLTTGGQNTFIGEEAGQSTNASTTGARNNILGAFSRTSAASGNDQIIIGYNITGKGDNTAFISANSGNTFNGANTTTWATTSDQRLKKNIVDNNSGLEKINAIRVRNFEYRLPEEVDATLKPIDAIQKQGVQLGVIAQELQAVLPDCVKTESTGVMTVQTDNLTWYLVNAIKEQQAIITTLTERITALEA